MKNSKKIFFLLIVLFVLVLPVISFAQNPPSVLVPCSTSINSKACTFNDLMALVNNVISFILFGMAVPISAIMFAYAGFLLITAGGEAAHARTKAKSIFMNALYGLVIALAAWLIISSILSILGFDGAWIGLHVVL